MRALRITIIIIAAIGMLLPIVGFAAGLEIGYPKIQGEGPGGSPAQWVRWIFLFSLGIVGIAAVGSLIYAGIVWMTSTSEGKTADAKSRIWAAILGILLVVGSVLILRTINPDLVNLTNPTFNPSVFQLPGSACPTGFIPGENFPCIPDPDNNPLLLPCDSCPEEPLPGDDPIPQGCFPPPDCADTGCPDLGCPSGICIPASLGLGIGTCQE